MNSEQTKEFFYKGGRTGVLLMHGFCGTPSEMRYLGQYLKDKGFTVMGICLKGHGTDIRDMQKATYRDWISSAVEGYKSLKQQCDEVFVVGLSMGGILGLYLARNFDIKGVVSLSAPIRILNRKSYIEFAGKCIRRRKFSITQDMIFKCSDKAVMGYSKAPLVSIYNLLRLIRYIKHNIYAIKKPVLIIQSYGDRVVNPASAGFIYNNIGSEDKSIVYLHKSGHVITCDCEKEIVFDEIYKFINDRRKQIKKEDDR